VQKNDFYIDFKYKNDIFVYILFKPAALVIEQLLIFSLFLATAKILTYLFYKELIRCISLY